MPFLSSSLKPVISYFEGINILTHDNLFCTSIPFVDNPGIKTVISYNGDKSNMEHLAKRNRTRKYNNHSPVWQVRTTKIYQASSGPPDKGETREEGDSWWCSALG